MTDEVKSTESGLNVSSALSDDVNESKKIDEQEGHLSELKQNYAQGDIKQALEPEVLSAEAKFKSDDDESPTENKNESMKNLDEIQRDFQDKLREQEKSYWQQVTDLQRLLSESNAENHKLQQVIKNQQDEINKWKERIEANDKAARKAIEGYKTEHQANIDKLTKKYNECKTEKDNMVVKFAQGEAKVSQLQGNIEKLEAKVKEKEREKDLLAEKLRSTKTENVKQVSSFEEKNAEIVSLKKEIETLKESVSSYEYRSKWAQNKLKSELDSHKDTKTKLDEMTRRYNETKEECLTIRKNCQEMIKTYQESEEIKSNSLDLELKKKEQELLELKQTNAELTKDLNDLKSELSKMTGELAVSKKQSGSTEAKVEELMETNANQRKELDDSLSCIQSLRDENSQIRSKLQEMQALKQELDLKSSECDELQHRISSMECDYHDFQSELESFKQKESDMMGLNLKVTERNTDLHVENSCLKAKLSELENTVEQQKSVIKNLEQVITQKEKYITEQTAGSSSELTKLQAALHERDKTVEELKRVIESSENEIKTIKKKQASSVKELTREVHTLRRQLEAHESKHMDEPAAAASSKQNGSAPVSLQHSRTNSSSSLDKPEGWVFVNAQRNSPPADVSKAPQKKPEVTEQQPSTPNETPELTFLEPDKQKLIEKIVKLQRANARKNEKLDFCEDHIRSLIEEVQRKSRIIQMYIMREEAGTLSSDHMDRNKHAIAKKGGIMASLTSMQSQDGKMSLDLSLQINHKLQAVLEDTLLKNIMLKENMDTLGQEIAKISEENSKLKSQSKGADICA